MYHMCVCRCCLLSKAKNEWMKKKEKLLLINLDPISFVVVFFSFGHFFSFWPEKKHYFYWLKRRTACKEINSVFFCSWISVLDRAWISNRMKWNFLNKKKILNYWLTADKMDDTKLFFYIPNIACVQLLSIYQSIGL